MNYVSRFPGELRLVKVEGSLGVKGETAGGDGSEVRNGEVERDEGKKETVTEGT